MALQVWLPLNGNFNNLGLKGPLTFTLNGTITDADGKLGKSKNFSSGGAITPFNFTLGNEATIALWVYYNAFPSSSSNDWLIHLASTSNYANAVFGLSTYHSTLLTVMVGGKYDSTYTHGFSLNTWYHIVFVWKNPKAYLYVNGNLVNTYTNLNGGTKLTGNKLSLASNVINSTTRFNGRLNDVRIYDHALSKKEIKEIYKCLIVHYKLDPLSGNGIGEINLVLNGWGGTENWISTSSAYVSTDVPETPTGITNSYSNTTSKNYIPIIQDHLYTMSGYVKKGTSSQSTCYLTLIPYDIDKLLIKPFLAGGFRTSSLTTLSQDLVFGDTIVHLTDSSGWANPSTYQNYIAIFGYKDSTGYTYPDLTYTRRVYQYGTNSDKSNLDIANNQVTLRAAYSGETIPAGTSVALSADEATYIYVKSKSNPSDWELLTGTFTPKNNSRLAVAKYVRVYAALYSGQWTAGITLTDNTATTIIYDCSGYLNHGTKIGSLILNHNSPRYNSNITNTTSHPIKCVMTYPESAGLTFACWMNLTERGSLGSAIWATSSDSTSQTTDYNTTTCSHTDTYFLMKGTDGTLYKISCGNSNVPLNTWTHVALTHDGGNIKLYINGTFIRSKECLTSLVGFKAFFLGRSNAGPRTCKGSWSDFRIYATALTEEDIKDLYNTSIIVDNLLNLNCYEMLENWTNPVQITKLGLIECKELTETTEATIGDEGDVTCNQIIEI